MSNGTEQEAREALLQYFGTLGQHWSTLLVAIGVVFFSIMQFRQEFWRVGLLETALFALGAQAVFAGSRVVLHGWFCELAVRVPLTREDNDTNQLKRVHTAMLRGLRREHGWAMRLPPFYQRALLSSFCWTLVWTIFAFVVFAYSRHWAEFCGFLRGVLQG